MSHNSSHNHKTKVPTNRLELSLLLQESGLNIGPYNICTAFCHTLAENIHWNL